MSSILFVEDEPELHVMVRAMLPEHEIHTADRVHSALQQIDKQTDLELILLDLHLPDGDGLEIARHLRAQSRDIAIIICTGQASVDTAIHAIELDVSAYLRKPFTAEALRATVNNALRKLHDTRQTHALAEHMRAALSLVHETATPINTIQRGNLHLDRARYEASYNNQDLGLSPAQFRVLWMLVEQVGEPVSPSALVEEALGYRVEEGEARDLIKSYISQLRSKLSAQAPKKTFIQTIRNAGYRWAD